MKRKTKNFLIIFIVTMIISQGTVFAADALYRFMNNDQDALIVGQIKNIEDEYMNVEVSRQIMTPLNRIISILKRRAFLNEDDNIKVEKVNTYSNFDENNENGKLEEGDYIIASMNKEDSHFKVVWGIYKLTSNNMKKLDVIYPNESKDTAMEAYSIEVFINSNGRKKDFSYNYEKSQVLYKNKVIYDNGKIIESNSLIDLSLIWISISIIILIIIYGFKLRENKLK